MRLYLLLLTFLLYWGGATSARVVSVSTAPPAASGISYLALGDSYTIGEGVGAAERWPVQLAALARRQGIALQTPDIIARTGWTTADLQVAIEAVHKEKEYGLVSLQIGVNNQFRGQTVALYRTQFRALLGTAVRLAGGRPGRVVVLSIPDWGQSPAAERQDRAPARIGTEIDQFNAAAQDECHQAGIAFVDITPLTRAAAGDAPQFTRDGLHYAGRHLRQWATQVLPVVRGLLPQGALSAW